MLTNGGKFKLILLLTKLLTCAPTRRHIISFPYNLPSSRLFYANSSAVEPVLSDHLTH